MFEGNKPQSQGKIISFNKFWINQISKSARLSTKEFRVRKYTKIATRKPRNYSIASTFRAGNNFHKAYQGNN